METGLYFSVRIGNLGESVLDVVDFTLEEALSTLFTLTLKVSSIDSDINLQDQLLQQASFTVYCDGEKQRTVNGIVETASRGDSGFKRSYYYFVIRPELWQLTLARDSRIFHFQSVPEILDQILEQYDIAFEKHLSDSHLMREYVTMKRESYYDFFIRLAAEEGISFWFEQNCLFYADSHLGMTVGPDLIYNPHPQSATREQVIQSLQFSAKMRPGEASLKDYKYSHPDVSLDAKSKSRKPLPLHSVYDSYGRYDDEKTALQFSRYRLEALQADSEQGSAVSNTIRLMPGLIFTLSEHPAAAMNDRWQVVKITHKGALPQSLGDESDGSPATLTNELAFIPGRNNWRAPFIHKPLADGAEIATVVGPAGEEIYVNEDGAVKVHFHWNRYDKPDEHASCWVRVVQNWNGDGFGFLSTPRIGQEVIVDYLNGDIDRPIITGTTYNGKNRPPLNLPKSKTQMTIKSKTHKGEGFNELRFEDENGRQEVFIHAQKDMNTKVLNDRSTQVMNNHKEAIDGNQTITVKKHKVETVILTSNELIGGAKTLSVGGAYTTTVVGAMNTAVGLSQSEEVGISKKVFVGEKLEFISGDVIEIRCGKSLIRMNQSGKVEIKGQDIVFDDYESVKDGPYKRQFVLTTESGEPIPGQTYKVTLGNGEEKFGITNQQGQTAIYASESPEDVKFELIQDGE